MDSQSPMGMDQTMMEVDLVTSIYALPKSVPTSPQDFNYFSHGLCQPWLETQFDNSVPGLLTQAESNSSNLPSIHSSNPAPTAGPFPTPSTSNGYKERPDTSPVPFNHYSTSTENTDFSPGSMCLDSFSANSSNVSICDLSFASFDFSSELMSLDAFPADSNSGSTGDASFTEFDFACSPVHPLNSPILVETHRLPHRGSTSNSPPSSAILVPRELPSRSSDLRKQKKTTGKPKICPICDKGFPHRRDLDRHIKSKHKDLAKAMGFSMEKIKCKHPSCSGTFERNDHLTRHLKTKHGEK